MKPSPEARNAFRTFTKKLIAQEKVATNCTEWVHRPSEDPRWCVCARPFAASGPPVRVPSCENSLPWPWFSLTGTDKMVHLIGDSAIDWRHCHGTKWFKEPQNDEDGMQIPRCGTPPTIGDNRLCKLSLLDSLARTQPNLILDCTWLQVSYSVLTLGRRQWRLWFYVTWQHEHDKNKWSIETTLTLN